MVLIVGVFGVGVGVWWLDGVVVLFIVFGIIWDGFCNIRMVIVDFMD